MPELSNFSIVLDSLSASADDRGIAKILYSRKDAAFALSLSIRSLDMLIAFGQLDVRRMGKKVMVPAESLNRYASIDHACLTRPDFKAVQ